MPCHRYPQQVPWAGTHLVSSGYYTITLHELVVGPSPQLRLLVTHPTPGRAMRGHVGEITAATWAADGATALLYLYADAVQDGSSSDDEGDDVQVRLPHPSCNP